MEEYKLNKNKKLLFIDIELEKLEYYRQLNELCMEELYLKKNYQVEKEKICMNKENIIKKYMDICKIQLEVEKNNINMNEMD